MKGTNPKTSRSGNPAPRKIHPRTRWELIGEESESLGIEQFGIAWTDLKLHLAEVAGSLGVDLRLLRNEALLNLAQLTLMTFLDEDKRHFARRTLADRVERRKKEDE